jgi:outer membrane protein OmpA-like peptidoglycan-associated protein
VKNQSITPKNHLLSLEKTPELNFELEKTVAPVKPGDDIADVFKINLIYFDLDKWNIRPDAAIDLAKV